MRRGQDAGTHRHVGGPGRCTVAAWTLRGPASALVRSDLHAARGIGCGHPPIMPDREHGRVAPGSRPSRPAPAVIRGRHFGCDVSVGSPRAARSDRRVAQADRVLFEARSVSGQRRVMPPSARPTLGVRPPRRAAALPSAIALPADTTHRCQRGACGHTSCVRDGRSAHCSAISRSGSPSESPLHPHSLSGLTPVRPSPSHSPGRISAIWLLRPPDAIATVPSCGQGSSGRG